MKKTCIALAVLILCLAFVFTACGKKNVPEDNAENGVISNSSSNSSSTSNQTSRLPEMASDLSNDMSNGMSEFRSDVSDVLTPDNNQSNAASTSHKGK